MTHELTDDVLSVLESTRLPLTMSDIIQDVSVMPIARGEPKRNVMVAEVVAEVRRLVQSGKVIQTSQQLVGYGTELVYRIKVDKGLTQRSMF